MIWVSPYLSFVFIAATALAAPQENHTTIVGLDKINQARGLIVRTLEDLSVFSTQGLAINKLAQVGFMHPIEGLIEVPTKGGCELVADIHQISELLQAGFIGPLAGKEVALDFL
jgi:hypothetical protein